MSQVKTVDQPTRQLVVIGIGLIGGSLAIAAKQRGLCQKVIGIARREDVCVKACDLGVVDEATVSLASIAPSLGKGDVIFIAVPTLSTAKVLAEIKACVSPEVTITDGASVKGSVLQDVQRIYGETPAQVVLGHPIAGSEQSGVEASNPTLYEQHRVILTPLAETGDEHLQRVTQLWQRVGAEVLHMPVAEHDEILAATSHLPHAIAYSLVDTLAHDSQNQNIFRYAAGGFRDFTRIASSDATMWRDIMLSNKDAVLAALDLFSANLARMRIAIESKDAQELTGIFTRAKSARDHFTKMLERRAYLDSREQKHMDFALAPSRSPLRGEVLIPGDKSISHRAVMLGALAEGITQVEGVLQSEDVLATIQAFRDLGVVIEGPNENCLKIYGVGLHGLKAPVGPLYLGNSGTSMRLLSGILVGQSFDSELTGDASLSKRPMARVAEPLQQMGAKIQVTEQGCAPIKISGGQTLKGICYDMPIASAQVKSAILLAGLYAEGQTEVNEPSATRDHTERMLAGFGAEVQWANRTARVEGQSTLKAAAFEVPGDFSSAFFFIVAASIVPGSEILLKRICINPTRTGALEILKLMGANIALENTTQIEGEPVADIRVCHSDLSGIAIPRALVSSSIDEFPALLIAACCADGETSLSGAQELRVKESDRIQAMAEGLSKLGIQCSTQVDGISVQGGVLQGGEVDSFDDHRIAMAFAIAGLRASGPVQVRNCSKVASSFPGFARTAKLLGISIEVLDS